ncbi:MAG: hypothetical protein R6U65_01250 [Perlabentimonas sp.]
MKTFFMIIASLSMLAFIACESQQHILVTVIDEDTEQALDSVFVQVDAGKNGNYNMNSAEGFTNESGEYETYMMIGCSFGCYDIQMTYTKPGYKELIQLNNTTGKISLEKEQK